MNITKKIGWQKYEDLLESQMDSPLLDSLMRKFHSQDLLGDDEFEEFTEEEIEMMAALQQNQPQMMVPVDDKLMENITLAQNFDCWMGHTNFNLTKEIRDKLNKTDGIEVLKICSRYRFFVGIGRMFDFKDVRQNIEKLLEE